MTSLLQEPAPGRRTDCFDRWTAGRPVASVGTNAGSRLIAFQGWHRFKESFAPELVAAAIASGDQRVSRCYDPFGGSGTTALTCQMLGVPVETTEVNPFLVDAIKSRTHKHDVDELARALRFVRQRARQFPADPDERFHNLPPTFLSPGKNGRYIFGRSVAGRIASLLAAIDQVDGDDMQRFFRVIVGGFLVDVSNVIVSGKGRRYRRRMIDDAEVAALVDDIFAERSATAVRDVMSFADRPSTPVTVHLGDARTHDPDPEIDRSVFSPPYPNSFDYTDVYNLELWVLGYLKNSVDNRSLRQSTLTSHVQVAREFAPAPNGSAALLRTQAALAEVANGLWDRRLPSMIDAYFSDMLGVLNRINRRMASGGEAWMVVGDSQYAGVPVPVAQILGELASQNHWQLVHSTSIRHMRSSAQQGGSRDLPESLVVLRREG